METLVRMVNQGLLAADVVRAFLRAVSLFPVGSWVKLSNGETARVTAANGDDYTRPIVKVVFGPSGELTELRTVDLSAEARRDGGLRVVKAVRDDEAGAEFMAGF